MLSSFLPLLSDFDKILLLSYGSIAERFVCVSRERTNLNSTPSIIFTPLFKIMAENSKHVHYKTA